MSIATRPEKLHYSDYRAEARAWRQGRRRHPYKLDPVNACIWSLVIGFTLVVWVGLGAAITLIARGLG